LALKIVVMAEARGKRQE